MCRRQERNANAQHYIDLGKAVIGEKFPQLAHSDSMDDKKAKKSAKVHPEFQIEHATPRPSA